MAFDLLKNQFVTPLTLGEQTKLDRCLEPARKKLSTAAAQAAWLEGWTMAVEAAVTEVLTPSA